MTNNTHLTNNNNNNDNATTTNTANWNLDTHFEIEYKVSIVELAEYNHDKKTNDALTTASCDLYKIPTTTSMFDPEYWILDPEEDSECEFLSVYANDFATLVAILAVHAFDENNTRHTFYFGYTAIDTHFNLDKSGKSAALVVDTDDVFSDSTSAWLMGRVVIQIDATLK